MKNIYVAILALFFLLFSIASPINAATGDTPWVNYSIANVKEGPGRNFPALIEAQKDIALIGRSLQVESLAIEISVDDCRGWIDVASLSSTAAKPTATARKPPEAPTTVDSPSAGVGILETSPAKGHKEGTASVKSESEKRPTANLSAALILLLVTILWLLLPLIPAIRELMKPTDIDPLRVVPRDSSAVSFFANNFRNYILSQVEKYDFSSLHDFEPAKLPDGTPFVRVQGSGKLPLKETASTNTVDHVVIAGDGSILPDDTTFLREVYCVASLMGGGNCVYRAILAEGEMTLQPGSIVLRWGHSVGVFNVHQDSILHGRASSDKVLHLMPGVTFEWIAAPVISVGSTEERIDTTKEKIQHVPFELTDIIKLTDDTSRYNGDLLIPDRSLVTGSLVVKGKLMIGHETCIRGNLKSDGAITLGDGCIVEGSVVTRSLLTIGENCILWGPIISEKKITLGNGSLVGTRDKPATVSAPLVNLHSGVVVTGMVVAQSAGKTLS